jgi:gliding motility-associated-like protein
MKATHLLGGEIIWECHPTNGKYRFTVRLYRECGLRPNGLPTAPLPNSVPLSGGPSGLINCPLVTAEDVSPVCYDPTLAISCNSSPEGQGAIQMGIYKSIWTTLSGVPPAGGWTFSYGDCCRPGSLLNVTTPSFLLRATMYSYNNINATSCYDNSPDFLEAPKVAACSGSSIVYNNLGFDNDLDSLYYTWATAKDQWGANANYAGGYSFNNPIPDNNPPFNPLNTGAMLDGSTGQINFTCYDAGSYVTVLKVEEWRCGQLIGEIYRDIPLAVNHCNLNITPPPPCPQTTNIPPSLKIEVDSITYPNGPWVYPVYNSNNTLIYHETTVYAKEQINLKITSFDLGLKPNCFPQNIDFKASGGNLSNATDYSDPNTCKYNAPCATISSLNGNPVGSGGFNNASSNLVAFQWQTDCPHLSYQQYACGSTKSVYEFYFRMEDDACPAPGFSYGTYKVNVLNYPPEPPLMANSCVALDQPSGDLSFDWTSPVDTGFNFDYFVIYHATSQNGPYVAIDTVNDFNITGYTHSGQGPGSNFYYMRTAGGCNLLSEASDTLSLINLNMTAIPPVNSSVALLDWNAHHLSNPTNAYYQVWRRIYPSGAWTLIDSTQNLSYNDTVNICSNDLEYQIRINGACYSTTQHAIFSDQTNNDIIQIDSITVSGSTALMHWQPTTETDAVAYIVLWFDPALNAYVAVDTLSLATGLPYAWSGSTADTRAEQYVIVSLDSCGNQSSELSGVTMKSLYLNVNIDACDGKTNLRWNEYLTFMGTTYDVMVDVKDDQNNTISTGTILASNTQDHEFVHEDLINGYEYCYYIRAKSLSGQTSTSNRVCVNSLVVKKSRLLYTASVNVRPNGSIETYSFVDLEADVLSYSVERATDPLGPYLTIGTIPQPNINGSNVVKFSDYSAVASENRYYYRLSATDDCGFQDTVSNIGTSILLEVVDKGNLKNTLIWNKYEKYGGFVEKYELYREVDNSGNWTLVTDQLTEHDTIFEDDVRDVSHGKGVFCYYIVAIEGDNPLFFVNDNGNPFSSRSNVACVSHEVRMFIPTAFNPMSNIGENTTWKPINVFALENSYQLEVYNRWGNQVFFTTSTEEGWDGKEGSKEAPYGVYNYSLKYKSLEGVPQERRGSFTLYRNNPQ